MTTFDISFDVAIVHLVITGETLHDITEIIECFDKTFEYSKSIKSRIIVDIDVSNFEGIGVIATCEFVKYLISIREHIKKRFECCAITMSETGGFMQYILNMYTPARPLRLFTPDQKKEKLEWMLDPNRES